MPAPRALRHILIGLGLFAGIASAEAALTITIHVDAEANRLDIYFRGQADAPFGVGIKPNLSNSALLEIPNMTGAYTWRESQSFLGTATGWKTEDHLPSPLYMTETPTSSSGSGGFLFIRNQEMLELISANSASAGSQIVWDGVLTYVTTSAGFPQMLDELSGTLVFTNGEQTLEIDWTTVILSVPEPSTYALVLGLGVAGVALLRRRARS